MYSDFYNDKILAIANEVIKENPELTTEEVAELLKNPNESEVNLLEAYGYTTSEVFLINGVEKRLYVNIGVNSLIALITFGIIAIINYKKKSKLNSQLEYLISYLEEINKGNYNLNLDRTKEGTLAKLENTIFKTTVMLKEYNRYLEEERKSLKNNLADISHQLKTPLTSIILMVENMEENPNMDAKTKEKYLSRINEKSEKIEELINILLVLSRLDASVVEFKKEMVNINYLITKISNSLSHMTARKNVTIDIKGDLEVVYFCDEKWQEEALTNILKNALEHSFEGGKIEISISENNFYVEVKVKDYGSGIKKEDLGKIFERFYKRTESEGFGIGLNLAKAIIEKENGEISVNSEVGEFTEFKIRYGKI